jgi:hypothetical protein
VDRPHAKKWTVRAIKLIVALLVLAAVGRHIQRTWSDLSAHRERLHLEPIAAGLAVPAYLAGLGLFGGFFARILAHSPSPVAWLPALRAYYISHLGKYVPGKALVVVLRAGLASPFGARPATAAFATVYETLVMMASGGLVAAVGFALPPVQPLPLVLGLGLGIGLIALAEPRVFPRLSNVLAMPFKGVGPESYPRFSHRLLAEGLAWSIGGWALLGTSQVAMLSAVRGDLLPVQLWPAVLAGVALATVAGFAVAVLPAGLGVREWVLMTTLVPAVGESSAVVSTLLLRLAWVVAELVWAAALGLLRPSLATPDVP